MSYFVLDGDQLSSVFDQSASGNSISAYVAISRAVDDDRESLAHRLTATGGKIELSVADTIIGSFDEAVVDWGAMLAPCRFSWSGGVGDTFLAAHAALAIAKRSGRGQIVRLLDARFEVLTSRIVGASGAPGESDEGTAEGVSHAS